jgi:LuxR family transcriptional regulator, quorum-sensing system regulator BjaR1
MRRLRTAGANVRLNSPEDAVVSASEITSRALTGPMNAREFDDACQAIADIESLSDPVRVIARLAAYLGRYGFTSFLVAGLPVRSDHLDAYILLNNWPPQWHRRYIEANHYRDDPCVRHCFATAAPFGWSELAPARLGVRQRRVMREAAECGLVEGLCVPLHDPGGFRSLVTMAGERVELPAASRPLVHLTSLYAYGAAERIGRERGRMQEHGRLTEREREVLRWIAAGKTAWDIGQILGIAELTVKDHLRNVRRKLGTSNSVHSVVEALRQRQISL